MAELTRLIMDSLKSFYGIEVLMLALLPVGADPRALIYKAQAKDQAFFVKLIRGDPHNAKIEVLELLQQFGIQQIIPPIKTGAGKLIQEVGEGTLMVYPFIQGQDGFSRELSNAQWVALGKALKQVHEISVPRSLQDRIRREDFSPKWRNAVRSLYAHFVAKPADDEIALHMWHALQEKRPIIQLLVDRSEQLSQHACKRLLQFVLCHSDLHGGNILIGNDDALYIVDWEDPIMAPKERDLMFIGGGVGNVWNQSQEPDFFYRGYGQTEVDWSLIAYYRHERIVEDIAVYSRELLLNPTADHTSKLTMYRHFMEMFAPHGVVDIAFKTNELMTEEDSSTVL